MPEIHESKDKYLIAIMEALEGRDDEKSIKAKESMKVLFQRYYSSLSMTGWLVDSVCSASDILCDIRTALKRCLKKGMAHSRQELEKLVLTADKEVAGWLKSPACKEHINSSKRLFDLVRYMRRELHEANLIDDSEYSYLCAEAEFATDPENGGSPSPRRLEDYDVLRERMDKMKTALDLCIERAKFLANDDNYLDSNFDPCKLGAEIRDTAKEALK